MLVFLPPSETKAVGGEGAALELDKLIFPHVMAERRELIDRLGALSADLPAARAALKVTPAKDAEITANARLTTAPTLPALRRYTGVLFDAMDAASLHPTESARAERRVLICSALFGAVRADDTIPAYRLSAGSRLPGLTTLAAFWRPHLTAALTRLDEPILDLRSGAYRTLAPLPGAITAKVVTERPDGGRIVVSHFNKATKGRLARVIAATKAEPTTIDDVITLARAAGMDARQIGRTELEIVT